MNSTKKGKAMIKAFIINVVIFALGLIAGMTLKAGYMLVRFGLTSEGNYYEAVFALMFGIAFGIATYGVLYLIGTIITNNK